MKKGVKVWSFIVILTVVGLMFSGLIDTTSATSEKTTINVLDSPPWFTKECYSKEKLWWWLHQYEETHDYYISTYVGGRSRLGGSPSEPNCWARFKPYLSQPGEYEVYAYFYAWKYTSTKVPFTVKYDGGSRTIKVNQSRSSPAWKEEYLGTWYFKAGADTYVEVTDAIGEDYDEITGLTIGAIKFVKKETVPTPVVTGIDPSQPTARPAKQWITIKGTGFVSDSTVTLRIDSSTHPIPADRTEFKSSTQIRVRAGLTDPGTWTAQVINPGNRISNLFSFTVKQDIPSPVHGMAVTNVYTTPSSPNVGQSTTLHVTVKNEGRQQENYVPVKAYVDGYQVGSAQYVTLSDGKSTTKPFTWTPSTAKTYSVKGEVGIVSGETDTSDNTKTINVVVSAQPVCIPKLSIPFYTPYDQRAHNGTELRYTINVTNEGTITGTIKLDVADDYNWVQQSDLSHTSVKLAPGDFTDVHLSLTVKEEHTDIITVTGTSQGDSSKTHDCKLHATNIGDGYGLFAAILGFKADAQEHTLNFNVEDYVKISAKKVTLNPSEYKRVNIVFDPKPPEPGDPKPPESSISTIDIDVTDTKTGESATIPIKFPKYEIIATKFDMATDSFSFANREIYGEQTCYGMSVTSILNMGKDTYSLTPREADEKYNILHIQKSWINHVTAWLLHLPLLTNVSANYEILKRNIKKTPLVLCFKKHAVVAYKIVEKGDESYIFIYENEIPYQIASDSFYNSLPYATYNLKEHTFNYDGNTKFDVLRADVHVTTIEEAFITSPIIMLKMYCPVNVTITDQYNRVISDDGTNKIPNATIISTEPKIFYLPAELIYHVTINAYEAGEFTLITVSPVTNTTASVDVFDNISITENTHATLDLAANEVNPMNIDYDGDGTTDEERYPDVNETIEINQPPIASFTYSPPHPIVNQTITFSASASYDPDGNITNYKWNFGNGNITNTTDPIITHTYVSAGDYTVRLTVTDDEGEYSYTESSITIKEPIKEPVFYVPDDYPSIQAAVDAASAGDMIIVREGTYYEKVVVDKSLTIKSSSGSPEYTIVDAVDPYVDVFSVTADHVNISGFTVTGAPDFYGIYLYNADYCDISDNICSHNAASGIYLSGSNSNSISNNTCFNNGMGGICLSSSTKNSIANNTCSNNGFAGIDLGCSNQNSISNNLCCNNKLGIFLDATNNNRIYLNNFINNDCNAYSCSSTNTWCSPVKLSYTYNGESHTKYLGNYWSDYTGTDANKNGIGDSPYSIDGRGGDIDQDDYPLVTWSEHYFNPSPTIPTPPTSTLTPTPRPTLAPTPTLTPTPRPTLRPTATLFEKIEGLTTAIRVCAGI